MKDTTFEPDAGTARSAQVDRVQTLAAQGGDIYATTCEQQTSAKRFLVDTIGAKNSGAMIAITFQI